MLAAVSSLQVLVYARALTVNDVNRKRLADHGAIAHLLAALAAGLGGIRGARDATAALLNMALDAPLLDALRNGGAAAALKPFVDAEDDRTADAARGVLLHLGEMQVGAGQSAPASTGGGGGEIIKRHHVFLSHKARLAEPKQTAVRLLITAITLTTL